MKQRNNQGGLATALECGGWLCLAISVAFLACAPGQVKGDMEAMLRKAGFTQARLYRDPLDSLVVGGHLKTGHRWALQNQPPIT